MSKTFGMIGGGGGGGIKLQSIAVTTPPTKTSYLSGERFDPAGMVVTATYSNGAKLTATGYAVEPSGPLSDGMTSVTIRYTEGGRSVTTTQAVTVSLAVISTVPSQSGSLTYTGSSLSPSWNNYNSAQLTIGGTTSATNAGTYVATFTPTSNYKWSDGTTEAKSVNWTIGKAAGSLSISPTSLTLNTSNPTGKITVTRAGNGTITAESSNTGIVTVSVSGNEVTVNNVNQTSGSATVTIKVSAGTNHNAPANKTCEITAAFASVVSSVLNDNDWATIRRVSDNGQGANYWSIGDRKAETLNGTVGYLTLNGTYYPFIVDFDHNKSKESPNAHTITFQFAKSALTGGADIAFVDRRYNSAGSAAAFRMNTTKTNSGGWTGSYMKKTLMPAFKSACSAALRAVIKPVTIYSDNVGGGSNTASNVTASSEEFYLPAEFEVHGVRSYANSAEQNYQTQLAYYKAGNSKVKYKHNATGSAALVWCRSAYYGTSTDFCYVHTTGDVYPDNAYLSLGVAPLCNV